MSPDRFGLYDYGLMPAPLRQAVMAICKAKAERQTAAGVGMVPCSAACSECVREAGDTPTKG